MPSDDTVFMIVLGGILLLSFYYLFNGNPIHNEGKLDLTRKDKDVSTYKESNSSDIESSDVNSSDANSSDMNSSKEDTNSGTIESDNITKDSSIENIRERSLGTNANQYQKNNKDKIKSNSYRSKGNNITKQVDTQFNVADVTKNYNDRYVPNETYDVGSPIKIENNKGTEKDKFDTNGFLPQEKEKDWFETIEPVDVKNSHLINIYRPLGANTIGSTHKAAIYDIRGLDKAVCPKFVVSPWLQSSYEPDRSSKSLCA